MQHHAIVQDCFLAILRLRTLDFGQAEGYRLAEDVYAIVAEGTRVLVEQPQRLGVSADDANEMAYAIAALADEVALSQHDDIASFWAPQLLQTSLFGENQAGERFFERLDTLLGQARHRRAAIMTYFTALSLGFMGRFGGLEQSSSELERVRQTTQRALHDVGAFGDETLAPRAVVPQDTTFLRRRSVFLRRLHLALGAMALATFLLGTGLKVVSDSRLATIIERSEMALIRLGASPRADLHSGVQP